MPHALNLTIPIAQDAETQKRLAQIAADFPTKIQPKIDDALRKSRIVHFARVLVIDNKYLQVITEYDGDHIPSSFERNCRTCSPLCFRLRKERLRSAT